MRNGCEEIFLLISGTIRANVDILREHCECDRITALCVEAKRRGVVSKSGRELLKERRDASHSAVDAYVLCYQSCYQNRISRLSNSLKSLKNDGLAADICSYKGTEPPASTP
jgi:hypothetical protein